MDKALIARAAFQWGGLVLLLALEILAPYRASTVSKPRRWAINLALTAGNGVVLGLVFGSSIFKTLAYGEEHRMGFLYLLGLGPSLPWPSSTSCSMSGTC